MRSNGKRLADCIPRNAKQKIKFIISKQELEIKYMSAKMISEI